MSFDAKNTQVVLSWLPGYLWSDGTLRSTGSAIPPTQHLDPKNGEVRYYVRPLFRDGATIGMFVRRKGIVDAVNSGKF